MKIFLLTLSMVSMLLINTNAQTKRAFSEVRFISQAMIEEAPDSLNFETITQKEYFDIKTNYNGSIKTDTTAKPDDNGIIKVTTKKYFYELPSNDDYSSSYYYISFIPELRSHLILHCGEGACDQILLDTQTDFATTVPSGYDAGPTGMEISPEKNFLLTYSAYDSPDFEEYYEYRSLLYVMTFFDGDGLQGLEYFKEFGTKEYSFAEVIWIDNNTVAIKAYKGQGPKIENDDEFIYLKADVYDE